MRGKMRHSIPLREPFRTTLSSGFNWSSCWAIYFTGVPISYTGNPIISGSPTCMFRNMIFVAGIYHLFEENSFGSPPYWTINKRTGIDGLSFSVKGTALFAAGGAGEFDEWGQADPTVIYDGVGDWKMWFDALNGTGKWDKLGYATSADGTTWAKYGSILSRGAAGLWDDQFIHHPACIKYNGVYYLYYSGAKTTSSSVYKIGLATSADGINWTKEATNPVITVGSGGEFDDAYIRPSCPIKIFNTWYMWYWAYDGAVHSMGLATSSDLIHWTKQGQVLTEANGISGSNGILTEGSNNKDKIIEQWYTDPVNNDLYFTNITLPTLLTKLSVFNNHTDIEKYGDSTAGTNETTHAANYIYFQKITVSNTFTANALKIYFQTVGVSGSVKLALYDNLTATPKNLLAISEEKAWASVISDQWTKFDLTAPILLTAADYWIAVWSESSYKREKVAGGANNWGNLSLAYGTFPNPVTATTTWAFDGMDIYLTNNSETIWRIALIGEPTKVYFNNIEGNKVTFLTLVNSEFDWFWASDVLYVYSVLHADIRYQITYE